LGKKRKGKEKAVGSEGKHRVPIKTRRSGVVDSIRRLKGKGVKIYDSDDEIKAVPLHEEVKEKGMGVKIAVPLHEDVKVKEELVDMVQEDL